MEWHILRISANHLIHYDHVFNMYNTMPNKICFKNLCISGF
uniref:Uncharacterized protein n=1 Tax=Arundo donax TaxID=35708 RepID=A0A0A9EZN8_ARUDO